MARHPIHVVLGTKGGVGATRRVASLARSTSGAIALDLDLAAGDLAWHLCAERVRATVAELAPLDPADVSDEVVDAILYDVRGGISVVPSPAHPELAEAVSHELTRVLVTMLASRGPVVVDGGNRMTAPVLAACRAADSVTLVTRTDPFGTRQIRSTLDLLARSGVDARIGLVPGRGASRRQLRTIERELGLGRPQGRRGWRDTVTALAEPWRTRAGGAADAASH